MEYLRKLEAEHKAEGRISKNLRRISSVPALPTYHVPAGPTTKPSFPFGYITRAIKLSISKFKDWPKKPQPPKLVLPVPGSDNCGFSNKVWKERIAAREAHTVQLAAFNATYGEKHGKRYRSKR